MEQLIECTLQGRRFALELGSLFGILPAGKITSVPLSPPCILGLTFVKGRLITVIDPFGVSLGKGKYLVLLSEEVALVVDEISSPQDVSKELLLDKDKILLSIAKEVLIYS